MVPFLFQTKDKGMIKKGTDRCPICNYRYFASGTIYNEDGTQDNIDYFDPPENPINSGIENYDFHGKCNICGYTYDYEGKIKIVGGDYDYRSNKVINGTKDWEVEEKEGVVPSLDRIGVAKAYAIHIGNIVDKEGAGLPWLPQYEKLDELEDFGTLAKWISKPNKITDRFLLKMIFGVFK
jgi:hypothetical protein